jgi:hypothetical protein
MQASDVLDADIQRAFPETDATAPDPDAQLSCLRELHQHYLKFFTPPTQSLAVTDLDASERIVQIETRWNRYEEERAHAAAPSLPTTFDEFGDWFFAIAQEHEYPEVCDYLANDASLLDIALLVLAEAKVDSRFDDIMALAQVGSSGLTKMTIARNYWDEMGNGNDEGVHTTLFDRTSDWMRDHVAIPRGIDLGILEFAEAYGNAAELLMYNLRRRYILRGLASIGLLEQSAPARFAATVAGCRRLGVPDHVATYQLIHASIDQDHSREWFDGVFTPIMKQNPDAIAEVALGVVIRGNVASAFFRKVHRDLFGLG